MAASSSIPLITPDAPRYEHSNSAQQLTLELEPGLLDRYASVREVIAAGIYQRGLTRIAEKLFIPPGNLSVQLSEKGERKFGVDDLELYIEASGDKTPILYLAAKYLNDRDAEVDAVNTQMVETLRVLLAQAEGKRRRN